MRREMMCGVAEEGGGDSLCQDFQMNQGFGKAGSPIFAWE